MLLKDSRFWCFIFAIAATLPGIAVRLCGYEMTPPMMTLVSGGAILAASFLLLWACDASQADIPQSLALAIVALIAVLPEYAVDMYFTWMAGKHPESDYAHYAIANMTGANRLLIGVAWGAVVLMYWLRSHKPVVLEKERRTELFFLGLATIYAAFVTFKGTLAWYDGIVFLGIYVWYVMLASRRPCEESDAGGPAELLMQLPKVKRRYATAGVFLFSAGAMLSNAEPFCEGLVATGKLLRINEFLLVQWLAPIASEAPEFIVALMFAWRRQAGVALGSLISAKLNQWTLLVGMIPGVFAISHGSFDTPIPMGAFQMQELMLTAAQSLMAVALLASMRLTLGGALLLFLLFIGQFVLPEIVDFYPHLFLGVNHDLVHPLFSVIYCVVAFAIYILHPRPVHRLREGLNVPRLPKTKTAE